MAVDLRETLERMRVVDGVVLAAVVTADGLPIEVVAAEETDAEALAAVASDAIMMAEALGRELQRGVATQAILEYTEGLVLIERLPADACVFVVLAGAANLGRARLMLRKHRPELEEALAILV